MTKTEKPCMTGEHARAFQEATLEESKQILGEFTKQDLVELSKKINSVRDEFYPRSRGANKRGDARQWFYDDELRHLFGVIRNPAIKYPAIKCVFQLMFFYCLRVSEVRHCSWMKGSKISCMFAAMPISSLSFGCLPVLHSVVMCVVD